MSKIIFLIGMSGAGKTEWGQQIAETYNLPFYDIDRYLEAEHEKNVTQLFSQHGEPGFRILEGNALRTIVRIQAPPFILSCGGGTPILSQNLTLMKQHGILIYLKATIPTLLHNLKDCLSARPMLTNGIINPTQKLTELYEKRKKIYEEAHYTFDVENFSVQDVAHIVAQAQ